jgi:hypothetical protein
MPLGFAGAHGHSGILGQGPASCPMVVAFGTAQAMGSWPERFQRTRRGTVLTGASAAKRQQGLHLDLLHRTGYKLQHGDLVERGRRVVLTSEAVGVVAGKKSLARSLSCTWVTRT